MLTKCKEKAGECVKNLLANRWLFAFNAFLLLQWLSRLSPSQVKTWMGYAEFLYKHLLCFTDDLAPRAGDHYKHFKGNTYQVIAVSTHTETKEQLVIYRSIKTNEMWARPLDSWLEPVKDSDTPRFQKMADDEVN